MSRHAYLRAADIISPRQSLTRLFLRALASATRLMGRALISRHFCLYSSTMSLVTGTGLFRCFFSSSKSQAGTSVMSSEFAYLQEQHEDDFISSETRG